MSSSAYFEAAKAALDRLEERSTEAIDKAAAILVDAIRGGQAVYSFGCSHSFMLTEEVVYRTGGLVLINPVIPHGMSMDVRPLWMTSRIERVNGYGAVLAEGAGIAEGDAVLVASTSGRNPVAIDFALKSQELGAKVIGITAVDYSDAVTSRHPDGLKLKDAADLVIDNAAPEGDAAVNVEGFEQAVGPLSTLTGVVVVNAIVCQVVKLLVDAGETPPVFLSSNLDRGDAHNREVLERNRHRINYL
jgi:uncharacterized phosphosugar-binding protein